MKFGWLLSSLLLSMMMYGQVDHWESIVHDTMPWHYMIPDNTTSADWTSPTFDESAWMSGKGGFGFGDNDDSTQVPPGTISVYHRLQFNVDNWNFIGKVVFNIDYDDAYVLYLNGFEIARNNITSSGPPAWDAPADGQHEAVIYQGGYPEQLVFELAEISPYLLVGENVLSVETHNVSVNSGDLTSRVFMQVGILNNNNYFLPTPNWFIPPMEFTQSNLPIVVINTYGVEIPDEPKIDAEMGIIDNGPGNLNHVSDPFNEFSGLIAIERRGSSSDGFPAKSYGLETRGPDSVNYNASIFNWPMDNDWILYAPYTDKSMIRNVLTYHLGNQMGRWAPRTQLCEVMLNGEYIGVYVFMERIKTNPGRVDIDPLEMGDTLDNALTGGYIVKIDKTTAGGVIAWTSPYLGESPSTVNIQYQMHDPALEEMHPTQLEYIQNYITNWEHALADSTFMDPQVGYRNYIDVPSFIDFFLVNEVSKNVDGYRISSFLYKERFSEGNRLVAGPLWDFNLGWGNANYCLGGETYGWEVDFNQYCGGGLDNPFWWKRMLQDSLYANEVRCRWQELRNTVLDTTYLFHYIDSLYLVLEEPSIRHFQRWPILGTYVWPNNFIGNTFEEEIEFLKSWTLARLTWMDENMFGTCDSTNHSIPDLFIQPITVFPNPNNGYFIIQSSWTGLCSLQLYTLSGQWIDTREIKLERNTPLSYSDVPPGLYFLEIQHPTLGTKTTKILIE